MNSESKREKKRKSQLQLFEKEVKPIDKLLVLSLQPLKSYNRKLFMQIKWKKIHKSVMMILISFNSNRTHFYSILMSLQREKEIIIMNLTNHE